MDFIVLMFLFLLPLAAVALSAYCLFHVLRFKKAAVKAAARSRLSGEDSFL